MSAKRVGKLKQQVAQQQQTTITHFYDYKEGYAELDRFNNVEAYREDLMNALESYDKMQSEARFLTLYDYIAKYNRNDRYICYLSIRIYSS